MKIKAFTLIELLIVVAIIAILAAIAVPNFLEAQTRAKTSRAKSDLRTYATGLESYAVDNNAYPVCNNQLYAGSSSAASGPVLARLSTPIAYITSGMLPDVFKTFKRYTTFSSGSPQGATLDDLQGSTDAPVIPFYKYGAISPAVNSFADITGNDGPAKGWLMYSAGPDLGFTSMGTVMTLQDEMVISGLFYDPTNGTVSYGDLWRSGGADIGNPGANMWGKTFFPILHANAK